MYLLIIWPVGAGAPVAGTKWYGYGHSAQMTYDRETYLLLKLDFKEFVF
jgi:hypothetical protein